MDFDCFRTPRIPVTTPSPFSLSIPENASSLRSNTFRQEKRGRATLPSILRAGLLAANQNSDSVVTFRMDRKWGRMTPTSQSIEVYFPAMLDFGSLEAENSLRL